ncbi:hypothetical protein SY83_12565 [Paenibacillus swuensis]|uniref:DUF4097 domain-containing protein n=1 Tax=Paenibacillus swuensis TaxID=1178515 RepID=A0A172TIS5_9BACL|nr:DUF4097 family beta strand repeat-containing protein [Paenibacillus swuensis]ANE46969.1 hypothetical protein SY83_12565 [Paenibacillus swuensis]
MKKGIRWALLGLAVGLVGTVLTFNKGELLSTKMEVFSETRTVSATGVKSIHIQSARTNIEVIPGEGTDIRADLEGKLSKHIVNDIKFEMENRNGEMSIRTELKDSFLVGINIVDVTLTVKVPARAYEQLKIVSDSGNILVNSQSADLMHLSSDSGNLHIQKGKTKEIQFQTDSGNALIQDTQAKLSGETDSGNIDIEAVTWDQDARLSTDSGHVKVKLAQKPDGLAVEYTTDSGRQEIEFEGFEYVSHKEQEFSGKFGDAKRTMTVNTDSGNFIMEPR